MIQLQNLSKNYPMQHGSKNVLKGINLTINPGEKVGILGRNGAGKSTLIRVLSGAESPTSGKIIRNMKLSWPLAFSDGFQGSLTGYDNLRFICRVYNTPFEPLKPFIKEFTELGPYLREPLKNYSNGMRARLLFAISMAIEFDCYLIDEVLAVGDSRFTERCNTELFEKRKDRSIVFVSHSAELIYQHCHTCYVLHDGQLAKFKSVDQAYTYYNQ